jgi:anti-sigma B factor antagonist
VRTFKLIDKERGPGVREIAIEGELDLSNAEELQEALVRASDYTLVLVDLSRCEFVDSTALAIFIRADLAMKERGGRLGLFGPLSQQVHRAMEIMGILGEGFIFSTAEEAEAAPGRPD